MNIFFFPVMCFNSKLKRLAYKYVAKFKRKNYYVEVLSETHPLLLRFDGKANGVHKILESVEVTLKDCEDLGELWN